MEFEPGEGRLDIYGYLTDDVAGGAIAYEHRVNEKLGAFLTGRIEHKYGDSKVHKELFGGLRIIF